MKKLLISGILTAFALTGCTYKYTTTPASMIFDGTKTNYADADKWKKITLCKALNEDGGDLSILDAAKKAGISKIKHIDRSYVYKKFLFWRYDPKECITVYGE